MAATRPWLLWVLATSVLMLAGPAMPAGENPGKQIAITGTVVDTDGKPVSGATVTAPGHDNSRPATTDAGGAFRLPVDASAQGSVFATLLARHQDGRLGCLLVEQRTPQPVRLVLKPPHEIVVRVTDTAGKPVSGAEVSFLAGMRRLVAGPTGDDGRWTGRVPADSPHWAVFARKAKVGFDFAVEHSPRSPAKPRPLPGQLQLTFDGARTLRVKTVDQQGRPIAGIKVGPWYVQKPGVVEESINLSGVPESWPTTGPDGTATLDWLPEHFGPALPIVCRAKEHYVPGHSTSLPKDQPTQELTITLLPLERLSGRVLHSDGQPAAGIRVRASGQGASHNGFHGTCRTDADGRYTFKAHSEEAYIVAVDDQRWAAPCRSDIVLRASKPVAGVDFVLARATRLHGRVTIGPGGLPAPGETVYAVLDRGEIPAELRQKGDRRYHAVQMYFTGQTDKDGHFEFHLGPGEYRLQGPAGTKAVTVTIAAEHPPAEVVRDFQLTREKTGPFTGVVLDGEGRPVAKAIVDGGYPLAERDEFQPVETDAEGRFTVERSFVPLMLHAHTSDRTRAGIARISGEATQTKIIVGPLASASGRLLDTKGNALARRPMHYGIRIDRNPEQTLFSHWFGGQLVTDAEGRFTLAGLIPGEKYEVFSVRSDSGLLTVTEVSPKVAGRIDLGDLKVNPDPPPRYVPPTPAQRTAKAFAADAAASLRQRKDKVLAGASQMYTRPLMLFGRPPDPACLDLFRLLYEEPEEPTAAANDKGKRRPPTPAELRWEFELASFDTDRPEVRKLAADIGVTRVQGGPPVLAVLDAGGSLMATYPLRLDAKQQLDGQALAPFLARQKLPQRDAERMLAEALQRAKAEDKRVFFIASASWCPPCRLLARFLAAHHDELDRHYVFVKLDVSRDEHADAVRKRFQGDRDGGVPWYAILDADARVLTTSNTPDQKRRGKAANIGFPSSAVAIEHFLTILRQTAPRLSPGQLAELRKALTGNK